MLCQIGPVKVLFKELPSYPLWPFWSWKLDPFKIENGEPDIVVSYSGKPISPEGTPVYDDLSTKVCRQIYINSDKSVIWQQKEKATGELQLQFVASPDWREITLTCDNSSTVGMGAFESLTFLIFYAFLRKNVLTFHGTLVEEGGRGFLLCASSGVGKTTHARLWRDCKNALIINGDRATCFKNEGKWFGFGTPWCGTSGEYLNRCVPINAVVVLEQGDKNSVSKAEGRFLLPHTVYPDWNREATEKMLSLLDNFLEKIPVLRLKCTPDASAVDVLYNALERLEI